MSHGSASLLYGALALTTCLVIATAVIAMQAARGITRLGQLTTGKAIILWGFWSLSVGLFVGVIRYSMYEFDWDDSIWHWLPAFLLVLFSYSRLVRATLSR